MKNLQFLLLEKTQYSLQEQDNSKLCELCIPPIGEQISGKIGEKSMKKIVKIDRKID